MTRKTAISRLSDLPSVFSVEDLIAGGISDRRSAHVYVNRWLKADLIGSIAPYSGIYFKVLHDDRATERCRRMALQAIHPEAVLIGHSLLHGNGWTTQPCRRFQLAVEAKKAGKSLCKPGEHKMLGDFELFAVDPDWFARLAKWIVPATSFNIADMSLTTYGYNALRPAAAFVEDLAQLRADRASFLDPDDYELDEMHAARDELIEVSAKLNCKLPSWVLDA
ncbi:hypothetical protein SAMN02744133_10826 [Thalassospira xiamenensis M-5 = DSM 17429]|uniref:Uncharacterized protein n=1 Tax=Thalassospira xiamenensis M-5 = DSM 17429 TaxID=1123366 RepID=A0AB72UJN9_9PROT|nr:hypothetical protein [Thalassospira xiamenensis]AJD54305.1 hypothetical protein TH3_21163 [Thalassospira xiamenensis M-5 = DSM 17429]SIT21004.1 hypothetical protein SAMN02744133_10826 [Thalassospira xiamenensis M-5 = DSM 17429]